MSITESKPLVILIALNLISLMVISWLISLLISSEDQKTSQEGRMVEEVRRSAESIDNAIEQELSLDTQIDDSSLDEETSKLEFYDDGSILRLEETDSSGNTHVFISNSLKGSGKQSATDADYIAALQELKQRTNRHMHVNKATEGNVQYYEARQAADRQAINYFNKVFVDKSQLTSDEETTLAQLIESEIAIDETDAALEESEYAQASMDDYTKSLDAASAERANETRTIKVKRGDTLWKIAIRAYGDGTQFTRIYKANPHIKNPDKIVVGETLRVPL